jgi:hypothetical protein
VPEKFKYSRPRFGLVYLLFLLAKWRGFFPLIAPVQDFISFLAAKERLFITDYGELSVGKSRNILANALIVNRFAQPDEMEERVEWCRIAHILGYRPYRSAGGTLLCRMVLSLSLSLSHCALLSFLGFNRNRRSISLGFDQRRLTNFIALAKSSPLF